MLHAYDTSMEQLIHAYLDGELDLTHALEVERTLAADPAMACLAAEVRALKNTLRRNLSPQSLPTHLQTRIQNGVGTARIWRRPTWVAFAASIALVAALSATTTWSTLRIMAPDPVASQLFDSHMRALMASQATDIASTDRHVVKPWFNGRLPRSPQVVDLAEKGYPLQGARIDVVTNVPVPTLVYRRRQHVISLTALPAQVRMATLPSAAQGFNSVNWADGDQTFVAISDLNAAELESFAKAIRVPTGR